MKLKLKLNKETISKLIVGARPQMTVAGRIAGFSWLRPLRPKARCVATLADSCEIDD